MSRKRLQARAVPLLFAASIVFLLCGAGWGDSDKIWEFDIPRQNVSTALSALAQQTGTQLLFPYDQVSSQEANPLAGRYTLDEALEIMLRGTGLAGGVTGSGVITISLETWANSEDQGDDMGSENKKGILGGVAAAVLSVFGAHHATGQETDEAQSTRGALVLEEIIVTAQKREERLQDVPISISALSGDYLDKSTAQGMTEILNRIPGVSTTVATQGGGTLVGIRGVASPLHIFAGSSPVSYYLDSIPFGFIRSAHAPDPNAYDLDRVEVLRGPQGTLYGASALNGVVRVLTRDADPDKFELKARTGTSLTQGGDANYRGDVAVNLPIIEGKLAARAVLGYQGLSGWIDKPIEKNANDGDLRNMRLKISAQPIEQLSLDASVWFSSSDFGAPSLSIDGKNRNSLQDEPTDVDYDSFSFEVRYDFSAFSLTSTSGYLEYTDNTDFDVDIFVGLPNTILRTTNHSESFSQEIILNSTHDGPWRWTLGGIYRDVKDRGLSFLTPLSSHRNDIDTSKSWAIFGELTRTFIDGQLDLTVGLRHFEDETTYTERSRLGVVSVPQNLLISTDADFAATTPRVVLAWYPREQVTVYASYAEGFRSGAPQISTVLAAAPQFPPMEPDRLTNYELGSKGSLGRLRFDTALFYIDWQDVQQVLNVPVVGGANAPALINASSASGIGFEFGVEADVLEGMTLSTNFSWNDLEVDGNVLSAGFVLFAEGERLDFSPKYTAGATADYVFPFGRSGYTGRISASANYTSKQGRRVVVGGTVRPLIGDSMLIGRTNFSVDSPDSRWRTTLFIDNVSDEDGPVFWWHHPADWAWRVRPRTVGLQLEYQY